MNGVAVNNDIQWPKNLIQKIILQQFIEYWDVRVVFFTISDYNTALSSQFLIKTRNGINILP